MIGRRLGTRRRSPWRLLFFLLFVAIVLLAISNVVIYAIPLLQQPEIPFPGQLLYITTFDAFNDQWTQERGQVHTQIVDGQLVATSDAYQDGIYSDLGEDLGDFDLTVDTQWLTLPDRYGNLAVLFRVRDPDNYYKFALRADGAYSLTRVLEGESQTLSEWLVTPIVNAGEGTVNRIRVVGRSFIFSFYVNDQLMPLCLLGPSDRRSVWNQQTGECLSNNGRAREEMVDRNFERGSVGFGVTSEAPGLQVAFDNVLIVGPRE